MVQIPQALAIECNHQVSQRVSTRASSRTRSNGTMARPKLKKEACGQVHALAE